MQMEGSDAGLVVVHGNLYASRSDRYGGRRLFLVPTGYSPSRMYVGIERGA